jgi:hypothetical protein
MEPWYKVATPRREVRGGRSFNPDEFAIALDQVVAGTVPEFIKSLTRFFPNMLHASAFRTCRIGSQRKRMRCVS